MKNILLFFLCFSINHILSAQKNFTEGYVVTLNGDTIPGFINVKDFNLNYEQCQFQPENSKEKKTYAPRDIMGYGLGDYAYFISEAISDVEPEKPSKFVEVLITGHLSLFKYKEHFIFQKDTLPYVVLIGSPSIREQNGVYINVKANLAHVGLLTYLFKDCPDIVISASNTIVNRGKLMKFTRQFNYCKGVESKTYSKKKKLVKFTPSVYANMGSTKLMYDESINKNGDHFLRGVDAVENSIGQFGFGAGFILPRISDRLMVELGLNFSSFDYSRVYVMPLSLGNNIVGEQIDDVKLAGKLVKIPLMLQYTFLPRSKTSPYIRAGAIFQSHQYEETGRAKQVIYQSYQTEDYFDYQISNPFPGLSLAIGVEQKIGKHIGIFVQAQLDRFSGFGEFDKQDEEVESANLSFKRKRSDMLVGFGLRLY